MAHKKVLRTVALVIVIVIALAMLYSGKLAAFQQNRTAQQTSGERKVLYWYDAMSPQNHYDKPGKAPDGMDLVPKYADAQPAGAECKHRGATGRRAQGLVLV